MVVLQPLKAFVAVMLAKWRYHPNRPADGCTEFASALAALPSSPTLELVADAVAAQVGAAVEALGFSNVPPPPPPPPPPVPQQTDAEFAELMAELGFEL